MPSITLTGEDDFSAVGQCVGDAGAGRLLADLYCRQADVHQGLERVDF
jgi:hypothetical protein